MGATKSRRKKGRREGFDVWDSESGRWRALCHAASVLHGKNVSVNGSQGLFIRWEGGQVISQQVQELASELGLPMAAHRLLGRKRG